MNCGREVGRAFLPPASTGSRLALPRCPVLPQSTAQGCREQLCPQLGPVPGSSSSGGPAVTLQPSHPAWEGSAAALALPGTASWSLGRVLFQHGTLPCQIKHSDSISLCRYNSRIVPALILDLAFVSQHCHNWGMWLEAENQLCVFPLHNVPKAWEQNVPLLLKHTAHISSTLWASTFLCQFRKVPAKLCLWMGCSSPGHGPALPEAHGKGTALSEAGRRLGTHSPHRSQPVCQHQPTWEQLGNSWGTAGGQLGA